MANGVLMRLVSKMREGAILESADELAPHFLRACIDVSGSSDPNDYLEPLAQGFARAFDPENKMANSAGDYGRLMALVTIDEAVKSAGEQGKPLRYTDVVTRAVITELSRKHLLYNSSFDSTVRAYVVYRWGGDAQEEAARRERFVSQLKTVIDKAKENRKK